jgi:acetoin utilization deacetylase AcuC-like enzyme
MLEIYYPTFTNRILHKSASGDQVYRLDAFEKLIRLKWELLKKDDLQLFEVYEENHNSLNAVHTPEYIHALMTGTPEDLANSSGVLWQKPLFPLILQTNQSLILSSKSALNTGSAVSLSMGGHHSIREKGLGFSPINNIAVAIEALQRENPSRKIAVLDLDVHYGNGLASILKGKENVLVVDLWNKTLDKWGYFEDSNLIDHKVDNPVDFFVRLNESLEQIKAFKPDLLIYHSGADVIQGDRMGGIVGFTNEDFVKKEKLVSSFAKQHNIPIVLVFGGGYVDHKSKETAELGYKTIVDLFIESINTLKQ